MLWLLLFKELLKICRVDLLSTLLFWILPLLLDFNPFTGSWRVWLHKQLGLLKGANLLCTWPWGLAALSWAQSECTRGVFPSGGKRVKWALWTRAFCSWSTLNFQNRQKVDLSSGYDGGKWSSLLSPLYQNRDVQWGCWHSHPMNLAQFSEECVGKKDYMACLYYIKTKKPLPHLKSCFSLLMRPYWNVLEPKGP